MARIAVIVGSDTGRYSLGGPGRAVTSGTSIWGPTFSTAMDRVIELHVEALFEPYGKRLHRRLFGIERRMAD
jgi:hypothetical protein